MRGGSAFCYRVKCTRRAVSISTPVPTSVRGVCYFLYKELCWQISFGLFFPKPEATKLALDANHPKSSCLPPRCSHRRPAILAFRSSSEVRAVSVLCEGGKSTCKPVCFSEAVPARFSLSLFWLLHSCCKSASGIRRI